jgi:hypothetical protein
MRSLVGFVRSARPLAAGVTAALTALAMLSGCGGSASSSRAASSRSSSSSNKLAAVTAVRARAKPLCDPTPCQITRAEFVAKLDYLCLRGNAALTRASASFEQATKASEATKAATALEAALRDFPPYQNAILGLEPPPAQDRAAYIRYVELTRRIHRLSQRIVAAGHARRAAEVIRLSQLAQKALATRNRAAVDLGTKHCYA